VTLAQPAEADIVFTSASILFGPNSTVPVDLNHDGVKDFTVVNTGFYQCLSGCFAFVAGGNLSVKQRAGNGTLASRFFMSPGGPALFRRSDWRCRTFCEQATS
jgi:hypothetical protein